MQRALDLEDGEACRRLEERWERVGDVVTG